MLHVRNFRLFEDTDTDFVRGHGRWKQPHKIYNVANIYSRNACVNYAFWPIMASKQTKQIKKNTLETGKHLELFNMKLYMYGTNRLFCKF